MRLRRLAISLVEPAVGAAFTVLWIVAEIGRSPNIIVMVLFGVAIGLSRLAPRVALVVVFASLAAATVGTATFPQVANDHAYPSTWLHAIESTDWPLYAPVLIVPALVALFADRRTLRMSLFAALLGSLWLGALVGASPVLSWNHGRLNEWVNIGLGDQGRAMVAFSVYLLILGGLLWTTGWLVGGIVRFMKTLMRDPIIRVRINDAFRIGRDPDAPELTARERDVLLLVADGRSNAQIATALFLSEATVKSHLRSILTKLGLRSRTEIVAHAWRTGMVQSS